MIHVIDTSSLIAVKDMVRPVGGKLWDTLERMLVMVKVGTLTFPSQVEKELLRYPLPDSISTWCAGAKRHRMYGDPAYETVKVILADPVVSRVCLWDVDPGDPADPYVLAQAYELHQRGLEVMVVCEDRKDKKDGFGNLKKASIMTACGSLAIPAITTAEFLVSPVWPT
jgi:hypothetical protein